MNMFQCKPVIDTRFVALPFAFARELPPEVSVERLERLERRIAAVEVRPDTDPPLGTNHGSMN